MILSSLKLFSDLVMTQKAAGNFTSDALVILVLFDSVV
jgi:hypothetical protein